MIEEQSGYMYVLSNTNKVYGANNLLNEKTLATIQEKIGDYLSFRQVFTNVSCYHTMSLQMYLKFQEW